MLRKHPMALSAISHINHLTALACNAFASGGEEPPSFGRLDTTSN